MAVSALPVKAPTKVVDVILTPPVYVPEDPVKVPSVRVPASSVAPTVTLPVPPPSNVKPESPVKVLPAPQYVT